MASNTITLGLAKSSYCAIKPYTATGNYNLKNAVESGQVPSHFTRTMTYQFTTNWNRIWPAILRRRSPKLALTFGTGYTTNRLRGWNLDVSRSSSGGPGFIHLQKLFGTGHASLLFEACRDGDLDISNDLRVRVIVPYNDVSGTLVERLVLTPEDNCLSKL